MIAFATALVLASAQPVPPREICLLNALKERVEFTYFLPGEPAPKGGYPVKTIEADATDCLNPPREPVSILAKTSKGDAVACNPSRVQDYTQYYVAQTTEGLECAELQIQAPAQ